MKKVPFNSARTNSSYQDVIDVSPEEVWEKKDHLCLIDVRSQEEFTGELGHVPGSKWIVLDILNDQLDQLATNKPIVFICRSGMRSAKASQIAKDNGFEVTYNMAGGMLAWNSKKLKIEN